MTRKPLPSWWQVSKNLSAHILANRALRRNCLFYHCGALLLGIALGVWPLDAWLREFAWRYLLFWCGIAAFTVFLMLLAVFDMMASVREEKQAFHREIRELDQEFPPKKPSDD